MLGFALCFVCLAATTWAWFTASVTSEANTIQTASFDVEVAVDGVLVAADANGNYALAAGTHTVTLKKTGNAEKVYFLIKDGDTEYYTGNLAGGDVQYSFDRTFTSTTATITPKWGEVPNVDQDKRIEIGSPLTLQNEDPADETQQEEEQENQQQEEENPSDENNPADDSENNGEGENTSTDTPAEGEGGQQGDEQQPSEPSTPTDGEGEQQGGDPIVEGEPSSSNVGDNTGGEPSTGGETGESNVSADTADTADTTTPTVQSEVVPADPAPTE